MLLDFEKPENDSQIEAILKVAGLTSLYESFGEAGPQLVLQSHIFACTGQISTTQKVTSITSLMSLTWSASRAFFIMRDPDHADADPSFRMVLLIVPFMLCLVLSSTFCLTMAGGILKYWVALIIAAIAFLNFLVQLRKCENKKVYKEDPNQGGRDEDLELLQTLRIKDEDNGKEQSDESKKVKTTTLLFFSVFLSPITIPSMALYYAIASIRISMDKQVQDLSSLGKCKGLYHRKGGGLHGAIKPSPSVWQSVARGVYKKGRML